MIALKHIVGKHSPTEEWARPGKPEWPTMLRLELTPKQAVQLIGVLAVQLEHGEDTVLADLPGETTPCD